MKVREIHSMLQDIRQEYADLFAQIDSSFTNELTSYDFGLLGEIDNQYNMNEEAPEYLCSRVEKFESYLAEKLKSIEKYGPGTQYAQIYNIFGHSNINTLATIMETDAVILINLLLKRYKQYGDIFKIKLNSMSISLAHDEDDEMISSEDILNKMPVSSAYLAQYTATCLINDLVFQLHIHYIESTIRDKILAEFKGCIDSETENELKQYSKNLHLVVDACNPYKLMYIVTPNYKEVIKRGNYVNYWPYEGNSSLDMVKQGLENIRIDANKLKKLTLLGISNRGYMGLSILEAISMRILYDLICEYKSQL